MKQLERTKTITYRWWRYDEYGIKPKDIIDSEEETTENNIIIEHIEALEESAEDRIFEMVTTPTAKAGGLLRHSRGIVAPTGICLRRIKSFKAHVYACALILKGALTGK